MELSDHAREIESRVTAMTAPQAQDAIQTLQDIFRRTSRFAQSVLLAPEAGTTQ
jgi:hypothetical protein